MESLICCTVFVTFVLCEAGPQLQPTTHTVLTKLVSHCDHPNDEVCVCVCVFVYVVLCLCTHACVYLCMMW